MANLPELLVGVGCHKVKEPGRQMLVDGVLAGFLLGAAGAAAMAASFKIDNVSLQRLMTALLFSLGLPMILVLGAELFTGNCLIMTAVCRKEATPRRMLKSLALVFLGNALGCVTVGLLIIGSGALHLGDGALGVYALKVGLSKVSHPFLEVFISAILCNLVVCLGIVASYKAEGTGAKMLCGILTVIAFVTPGFSHCIADIFYQTLALAMPAEFVEEAMHLGMDLSRITLANVIFADLLPATLGNFVGGALLIALPIHFMQSEKH